VNEALLERHRDSAEDDEDEDAVYTSQDLYAEPNAMAAAAQQNMIACKAGDSLLAISFQIMGQTFSV
jgi:hypothetical protein